jgi:hypothetical protein
VSKSTINKARGEATGPQQPSKGASTIAEAIQELRDGGVDVSQHDLSYGFVERGLASGAVTHQYTVRAATRKPGKNDVVHIDTQELLDAIANYNHVAPETSHSKSTFVICPSDMQIGKTSFNGGTPETTARVLASFAKAAEFCRQHEFAEIIIAELGDPIENFNNTASQRETNDLDITGQIRVTRRLLLEGIKMLAPYAPVIKYVTVPSNHGSVRIGFKSPAGDNHNDWGLEIADQLADAIAENIDLKHVTFVKPDKYQESVALTTSGTTLGFVHGHQAGKAESLGLWWAKQDHGRMPTANADILLAGHFHSFRTFQSGNARWVFISPASDPGSDWFTNLTGESSKSGMLSFTGTI